LIPHWVGVRFEATQLLYFDWTNSIVYENLRNCKLIVIMYFICIDLIKLIKPSNTTIGESQVTRYSIELPGLHVSVCRDHDQVLRAKD